MTTSPVIARPLTVATLTEDARNRALRTFVQGLSVDALAAIGLIILPLLTTAQSFDDVDWKVLIFLVVKSVVVSAFSYVMRRFGDPSGVPSLTPPTDPKTDEGVTAVGSAPVDPIATEDSSAGGAVTVQMSPGEDMVAESPVYVGEHEGQPTTDGDTPVV